MTECLRLTPVLPRPFACLVVLSVGLLALAAGCSSPTEPTPTPDPAAPKISCPANVSINSLDGSATAVVYPSPTVTLGKPPVTTSCTPASSTVFKTGETTVTCTASDALQRADSCQFKVTVVAPKRLSITRFIAFGDSITLGQDGYELRPELLPPMLPFSNSFILTDASYPETLRRQLLATYTAQTDDIRVFNDGWGGEFAGGETPTDTRSMDRFQKDVLGATYQAVLLMEGSNDVWFAALNSDPSFENRAITNLGIMTDRARAIGIRVYLATIAPQRQPNASCVPRCRSDGWARVPAFNDRIRTLAAQKNVTLVDVYAAFNGDLTLISGDGLHPNAQGFERIAQAFMDRIRATVETSPTFTASGLGR